MKFGYKSTATEVAKAWSSQIRGKTVLITGVSPGSIGETTAMAIGSHQPKKMILASRTMANMDAVASNILKQHPDTQIQQLKLDLSSQKAVRAAAAEFNSQNSVLDILINNAGIMALPERQLTPDGIEMQFATNHIGHFLFTNLIMDALRNGKDARIINISSNGHRFSPVRFDDYNFETDGTSLPIEQQPKVEVIKSRGMPIQWSGNYERFVAYGQSKAANILFSLYLRDRLAKNGIMSFSVHPGTILTNLARDMFTNPLVICLGKAWMIYGTWTGRHKTTDGGAATSIYAAFDPNLTDKMSIYLEDCGEGTPSPHATDIRFAERLWSLSEELVGQQFSL